jgi:hypothetical protein
MAALLTLVAFGSSGNAQQQTPQATFRTTTRLIVQTVTVKDKEGKSSKASPRRTSR